MSSSFVLSTEGDFDDLKRFPFATHNGAAAAVELGQNGWPIDGGRLRFSIEDQSTKGILTDNGPVAQAIYEQQNLGGVGDVTAKVRSDGDWEGSLARRIDGQGNLRAGVDSRMGWNLDLDQEYNPIRGIRPSASYGATQDGVRLRMGLDKRGEGPLGSIFDGSYAASNPAGYYSLDDVTHDGKLVVTTPGGGQSLQARGAYDRRFRNIPLRGSLGYAARGKSGAIDASLDYDRYRLKLAREGRLPFELAGAIGRTAAGSVGPEGSTIATDRPAELQLNVGQVSIAALRGSNGPPRVRLGFRMGDSAGGVAADDAESGVREVDVFGEPL